jgi:hypothetical protein
MGCVPCVQICRGALFRGVLNFGGGSSPLLLSEINLITSGVNRFIPRVFNLVTSFASVEASSSGFLMP